MKKIEFSSTCYATAVQSLKVSDEVYEELMKNPDKKLSYIRDNLGQANVEDIYFLSDLDDVYEAVTEDNL
ncbi:hypothetical protein [Lachnospira multipara]|uniref:hypothetical protein n=1 Tax=Lachnospira multipara TaxID=28051 RepID=UPI000414236B|nr:hypothetical protein [Lachnospira multipara]